MLNDLNSTWLKLLHDILEHGSVSSPRGKLTKELLQRTILVDTRHPVLTVPTRQLGYRFMAAEAYWILTGDDRVATIAPYSSKIAEFSDDGEIFFGAYGPRIQEQLAYVVGKLSADRDTRQAGLTLWQPNPPPTKDYPCTIAIFFSCRHERLNAHVFMRSSDAWLGVPYDVFNFSMLIHLVCGMLREQYQIPVIPGALHLTAASSHLYETNWEDARRCLAGRVPESQPATPEMLHQQPQELLQRLKVLRDTPSWSELRWWKQL